MKMSVVNRKFSILILPFLLASFVLVGCGEDDEDNNRLVEDNNQPVIEAIPDKIVDADGAVTVEVNITDVDGDDTHTIRASSNNKAIATVSAKNTTLTINGIAGGMATITVSVTDNSGQENAAATPVTFKVIVNPPKPRSILLGLCKPGMIIKKGESCSHPSTGDIFSVDAEGKGHFMFITAGTGISLRAANITFVAKKRDDGSWEIEAVRP